MRQIIGLGETILDIVFQNNKPHIAVPGGSVFNTMVSLSRIGLPVSFISELGNDHVGEIICDFMKANGMTTEFIERLPDAKSPVSLAFLSEDKEAEYLFYRNRSQKRLNGSIPTIRENDILIFGSYYALNPDLHERVTEILQYAKEQKAIIYYDLNFRKAHAHEAIQLRPNVIDNYEFADIVRGSEEDFSNLYRKTETNEIYRDEVKFYCKRLINTHGTEGVDLRTDKIEAHYDVKPVTPVSSIGTGDSFNAGILYGLIKYHIGHHELNELNETTWSKLIAYGMEFAAEACESFYNYISPEFAAKYDDIRN